MIKLKLIALILLLLSGVLIIYGNPWDSTVSSHYVQPPEAKSGSSANLTALNATDWVYKVTGPDDSTSVQVQNLGDVVSFELDATAPNYVWGNILVLYDKTKLAAVSIEENPANANGFWAWWTPATGQSAYGGGGDYYYYDYVAGTSIANQGSQWAKDWVNIYGGGGPVGTINPNYGSILDPNSADYQALVNKGISNISNLGAIRLYTSTYAGGLNNNSPLRLGFQVISTSDAVFNVFSDDATSYNWYPASLPWHLQSSVALTLAPPLCPNMQSDTKTEYGSTVTISGPIEVFANQPYLINLSAQTDAPIYQWSLYENGVLKDGQGFVWGNQFAKTMTFSQSAVGDYTYIFNYRGIMGAHGWPPYTAVSITVKVISPFPKIEELITAINQYYQNGLIKNSDTYDSLYTKATGAQTAINAGNYTSALGKLKSISNQINTLKDESIDPVAKEDLFNIANGLVKYYSLLTGLPTTINFNLIEQPCANRTTIEIPTASTIDTVLSGDFTVLLGPTSNPNVSTFNIIESAYTGTPLVVNELSSGTLYFSQDPNNPSTGTLNLTTGEISMVQHVLVTSSYLEQLGLSPVALEIPQTGIFALKSMSFPAWVSYFMGHGIMPDYLPVIGGLPFWAQNAGTEAPKNKIQIKGEDGVSDVIPYIGVCKTVTYVAVPEEQHPPVKGTYKWTIKPADKAEIVGPSDQQTVKIHGLEEGNITVSVTFTPEKGIAAVGILPVKVVKKLVKIDPGHGGKFSGAVGPTGLEEKDVNLDIALKLKAKLEAEGVTVLMTRETDTELGETLNEDLDARAAEIKRDQPHLLISIHQNADGATVNGTETLVTGDPKSPATPLENEFAQNVQNAVNDVVQEHDRGVKTDIEATRKHERIRILRHDKNGDTTSCLNEATFISNKESEAKLKDDKFLDDVAGAMKDAILETLPE